MPINFACAKCGANLSRPYTAAGKSTTCEVCGTPNVVPKTYASPSLAAPKPLTDRAHDSRHLAPSPVAAAKGHTLANDMEGRAESALQLKSAGSELLAPNVFAQSYAIFRQNMGSCLAGYWVATLMMLGAQRLLELGVWQYTGPTKMVVVNVLVALAAALIYSLVVVWLAAGLAMFMLNVARGTAPTFTSVLGYRKGVVRAMAATLLLEFGIIALLAFGCLPAPVIWFESQNPWLTALVGIATFVPAMAGFIWLALSWSQYFYLTLDRGLGPLRSLAASYRLTSGNRVELLLISLVGLATPLSICACGIGVVFWLPYLALVSAVTYLQLTGHWLDENAGCMRPLVPEGTIQSQPTVTARRRASGPGILQRIVVWLIIIALLAGAFAAYLNWLLTMLERRGYRHRTADVQIDAGRIEDA